MSKIDLKRDSEKRLKSKFGRKHKRDMKLQELEKQLQFAESRCGTLKQQLDYIKQLYGCPKCTDTQGQFQPPYENGQGGGDNVNYYSFEESRKLGSPVSFVEHKENSLIADYAYHNSSNSNTTCTNSNSNNKQMSVKEDGQSKGKSQSKQRNPLRLQKLKKKNSKKLKRRRRIDDTSSSKFSNVSSQTQSQVWQDPVVEIYKNSAVNAESESGLEIGSNKRKLKVSNLNVEAHRVAGFEGNREESKEKVLEEVKQKRSNSLTSKKPASEIKEEGIQTDISLDGLLMTQKKEIEQNKELYTDKESITRMENPSFYEPLKSYCQPTISSKRKQVDRDLYSSFNNINIRSIPFIAAKSTTPSHNIGVNIQQVLSIIKKRHVSNENSTALANDSCNDIKLMSMFGGKKMIQSEVEHTSEVGTTTVGSSETKKRPEGLRSNLSHWISNSDVVREKQSSAKEKNSQGNQNLDWSLKVDKLKKVLVFLHEDFTSLSQKYKRLQKKLKKRNISKTDAKGELADIEKDLEKKEEEITVVIGLYKEVLNLREDMKKLQNRYDLLTCEKVFVLDGLKQSNSAHTQMTMLLRKIQNFQDKLKG
ncbi:hypothetical protein RUM44_000603 [Polyplax serrata]|uniref:Uncharacterized protein n=1 Tax=Polyplax serrata TaxID=468196 RepID=A0ABR1B8J2_POLSC